MDRSLGLPDSPAPPLNCKLSVPSNLSNLVRLRDRFPRRALLLAAVEAGAQGFLLKGASSDDLIAAIEGARHGEHGLSPVATQSVHPHLAAATPANAGQIDLGKRELEILRLLTGGYSNKEIARSLNLAEGTVKNYVSEILVKLGTQDRTRAVLKAITLRLV